MHRITMNVLERWCMGLRHWQKLERAEWLWSRARPIYVSMLARLAKNGLERVINQTDRLWVRPELRGVSQSYEPEVWAHLMSHIRPGDVVADVGAFVGLYALAIAQRVGSAGKVFAFEPDPQNFAILKSHVELNKVTDRVSLFQAAVADCDGVTAFDAGGTCESHINSKAETGAHSVRCVSLDTHLANTRLDILKIDVEGYEEVVLRGAIRLLQDRRRCPRLLYVETHPYAWPATGTSSESLLGLLTQCQYRVYDLQGQPATAITRYGEIVAYKN
ncbi:MAG: FkbM family methyltransferase [Acidobacteria bacterium]|nr:FkbM family methyltransferase [Acidobacteriota bacterium]MBI3657906.1 FkbM family methyltransferase [Acidobacteriota bacterium]